MTDVPQAAVAHHQKNQCVICLEKLDTEATEGLTCGHVYHAACIQEHCRVHSTSIGLVKCPLCQLSSADLTQANTITVGDDDMDHDARGSEAGSETES